MVEAYFGLFCFSICNAFILKKESADDQIKTKAGRTRGLTLKKFPPKLLGINFLAAIKIKESINPTDQKYAVKNIH